MTSQRVKEKKHTDSYIVTTDWRYCSVTPAFRRLMQILLRGKEDKVQNEDS